MSWDRTNPLNPPTASDKISKLFEGLPCWHEGPDTHPIEVKLWPKNEQKMEPPKEVANGGKRMKDIGNFAMGFYFGVLLREIFAACWWAFFARAKK